LKSTSKLGALLLVSMLTACSTDKDNSEPPAPLTDIEAELPLSLNWKLDTRAASNEAAYRLRPLIIGDRAYTIDTSGMIASVDVATGQKLWDYATELLSLSGLSGNENLLIATSGDGDVAAFRFLENGLEPLWKIRIGSEIRSTPAVDGDQVFVRSVDGKLRSLSIVDGSEQ